MRGFMNEDDPGTPGREREPFMFSFVARDRDSGDALRYNTIPYVQYGCRHLDRAPALAGFCILRSHVHTYSTVLFSVLYVQTERFCSIMIPCKAARLLH
jgi:hypothetical protein